MTRFGLPALQGRVKAAVDAEGIRPFARRAGVGVGVVRSMLDGRDPSYSSAEALATALQLDLGFGPIISEPRVVDDSDFAHIPLHAASLAAGSGHQNGDEAVIGHLAFRRDWLKRIGVVPASAVLARADGDSMEPCLCDGDLVLIDRSPIDIPIRKSGMKVRRPSIYAFLDDGQARIKRIDRPSHTDLILLSDNPHYPPQLSKVQDIDIIGKVMWWGHTNRE